MEETALEATTDAATASRAEKFMDGNSEGKGNEGALWARGKPDRPSTLPREVREASNPPE
jgi:hypothetical protein